MDFDITLSAQLGPQLKALRKLKGVSQEELGRQIGVKQARVADIEANPGLVSVDQLLRILQVLGATLAIRTEASDAHVGSHGKANRLLRTLKELRREPGPLSHVAAGVAFSEADESDIDSLARMLGYPAAAIRTAMAKVAVSHPRSITEKTTVRDIPESVFPELAKALDLTPTTFARLYRATLSRLDSQQAAVLDRPTPKGSW